MIGLPTSASSRISTRLIPASHRERGDQPVERLADGRGHLAGALGIHHRVGDAAHQVLAEADLRVHHAVLARTAPSARSARWPAIVVEPTSIATP